MSSLLENFTALRQAFNKHTYPELSTRRAQLQALRQQILLQQAALLTAARADFGQRSDSETRLLEILPSISSIDYSLKKLSSWLKPIRRHVGWLFLPAKNFVCYQPVGVVGVIVPWNYPIFLSLGPLITAISAGNKVMVKLSEFTPQTNQVLKSIIENALPDSALVIEGDADIAASFSQLPFDHLLYTGSTAVGKLVMQAASKNLTPVTLELGGKSPLIIGPDIDVKTIADRIVFGKTTNAGQTCVAPDYLLVPRQQLAATIDALKLQYQTFYPADASSDQYTSVINQRHFARLAGYLTQASEQGASIISCDGKDWQQHLQNEQRLLPLQLVLDAPLDTDVWQQEIFGPVLPILPYDDIEQALEFVRQRPRPLALYLFSYNAQLQQQVLQQTHAGGVCLNETVLHVGQDDLPFGGIGPSGMGHYHGHEGFLTFSHAKAVHQKGRFNSTQLAYPQHRAKLLDKVMKFLLRA
ncbi:MAG: coniferyl aldehyde dehydrogenase [Gammaproteobacteria bacterium]|nr:coniferyl aldehyde dehydrogenase [Gammaproteobacteria bacterium]